MNHTGKYELSIIVPVYNEEDNIVRLANALTEYIGHASVSACVLFVNDGSHDHSLAKIKDICRQNPHLFYIGFDRNHGLSAAIKAGIDRIESRFTGYIDADLQTTPEDFEKLLPYRNDFEIVTGIRTGRMDSFGKKISSKIANGFRRLMTGDGIEDTGCPLKIFNTETARCIPFFNGMHRFLPALVLMQEGKVKQIPVRHFERIAGKSKFHLTNRIVGPFVDCFAYRWMKKRTIHYRVETSNTEMIE